MVQGAMPRKVRIWTWDRGNRAVDMDAPTSSLAPVLETVLNGALWRELKKLPVDTLERLLPEIAVPPNVRRLVEIWIEEKRPRPREVRRRAPSPRSRGSAPARA
jgi:hypothetical protein